MYSVTSVTIDTTYSGTSVKYCLVCVMRERERERERRGGGRERQTDEQTETETWHEMNKGLRGIKYMDS